MIQFPPKLLDALSPSGRFAKDIDFLDHNPVVPFDPNETFDLIFSLTKGGPGDSTTVINMLIYNRAFDDLRLGYASALALLLFAITAGILAVAFLLARRVRRAQPEGAA